LYLVVLACLLVSILVGGVALIRIKRSQNRLSGQRFAQLGVSLGMTNVLLGIGVLPNLMGAENRARYERGATESRAAINQVLAYAKRMGAYPTSLHALRTIGIAPIRDKDPWGNDWVLSPELVQGSQPGPGDDVYIYSRGPRGTAIYRPGVSRTGGNGAVGYSTRHGSFRGC
jgi:type II secretory pathway pseudopilin PulG